MTKTCRWATAWVFLLVLMLTGCAGGLPPITIQVPPRVVALPETPPVVTPAPVAEAPIVVPDPEPAPVVVDERPWQDLKIVVHSTVTGLGIPGSRCVVLGEERIADNGDGFIHYPVRGSVSVRCAAEGYQAATSIEMPPGDQRFPLVPIAPPAPPAPPPAPPVVTPPSSGLGFAGCGKAANTMAISGACLTAVADASKNYPLCQKGDGVACHRFVREVALALRTTQADNSWGLLSKPRGQWSCSLTACGPDVGGYAEDMVTYLPQGNPVNLWTGLDIMVAAGAPGAHHAGGPLPPAMGGRPDNLWAPVP